MYKKMFQRVLSLVMCLVLVLTYLPAGTLRVNSASQPLNVISGSKKADNSTIDWENYFGPDKMDTEFAGGVWTDKSVFTGPSSELPGVSMVNSENFLVALSAIASNLSITGHTSMPTDTMLVLDLSGSMVDDTYEVGTVYRNRQYQTAYGVDMALINAMVEATNATIEKLMKQNSNNRVGVVLYSGNASTNEDATPDTASVVLPLGRYSGVDGEYLAVDTTYRTDTLYVYSNRSWRASGTSDPYVPSGTAVSVSVKDSLKTEAGAAVADVSKRANGGTYIQNGLYKAMQQFLAVTDTTVPAGRPQEGAERMPVLVLMSDGAPTIATTSYNSIGDSNTGDGTTTNDRITFLTQLTAAYVRGRVAAKYQESSDDKKEILFLTLGLGTENSSAATNTLYPAGSNETLTGYWNRYLAGTAGQNVAVTTGNNAWNVYRDSAVEAMNYVDKYFYASNAQGLIDSFTQIVGEIELKAESYATLVEGTSADLSGYVTFEDELGELMHVADMKGVLMSDGNGGTVLYTGKGIAESMTAGKLGSQSNPTDRGNELVRTVKERIPGTTTTQAQQLIANAYNDKQLYYESDSNWSNYIGWYADADGNYVGFWDKDSGYTGAPDAAKYANKSYGYLGVNGDSDMMHVVVMVRTDLTTLHQTVYFKIPASLLPTVQYKVTLDEDDPTVVESFTREGATPMQLVFEVGLRPDINSVNMEQKIAEHIQKGGHVHRNSDGSVTFYTNEWAIGNDLNNNGIPDADEVETALVAESHFHPALDNSRYYYTEDTPVLDAGGNPVTGATRPTGTYYHNRYIYNQTQRVTLVMPIDEEILKNEALYDSAADQWYIPAGTMYHELARFKRDKNPNVTGTLPYYDFPAAFENGNKQDIYAFLGNNGAVTVAPATGITLNKQVQGTIDGVSQYTFQVTLSNIPAGAVAAPVLTDANGDPLSGVTMSAYANSQFTVTMPANVTAYISGIPVGTTVQVAEQIGGDYKIASISVAGQTQSGTVATATIPAYSATASQMVPVVITNAPNTYGDLVISKDIIHDLVSDPAAMATKEFTFRVKLTGDRIKAGDTFTTSEGKTLTVGSDGYLTYAGGELIKLKNEESVTINRIPEGTAYLITEDSLPGFKLDNINGVSGATQASGTVTAAGNLEAFYNRYPDSFTPVEVPVTLDVTKVLNEITNYPYDEDFIFVLQMLRSDGTYPNIPTVGGQEYLEVGAGDMEQAAFKLTFQDMGTYYFRVVELRPSERDAAAKDTAGMSYSTMRALFEVVVTDDDMDGVLEIAVNAEANVTVTPSYVNNDHEQISGIAVAATFENTYEVNSTSTTLNVHKTLNNPAEANKSLTEFHFELYPCDAGGNVAANATASTVTTSALGDATFNIFLDTAGTYHYKISEVIPAGAQKDAATGKYTLNGMTYDPAQYLYTVVAEVNASSELVVTSRTLTNLTTGQPVNPVGGVYTAQFVNDYNLTPDSVLIPISKELTGRAPAAGESYQAKLVKTDGSFAPLTGTAAWNDTYTLPIGSSSNVELSFDKVGTYHYTFTEVIPVDAQLDASTGKYVSSGVVYDNSQYHITVTVADNGAGALEATMVIHKLGEVAAVSGASFTNVYEVTGEGQVTIGGKKVLNGRALVANEFTIGLYSDAQCRNEIATTTNNADGTFSFPTLTYTPADLGQNNASKTYTYYVKEVTGQLGGMTYDPNTYTVTVTLSHKNGSLVVTPSGNAANLTITNTYRAEDVSVTINGSKALSGDWTNVANKTFTFQLFRADESFTITNQNPVQTKSVTGNGPFSMKLDYEDGDEGYYYYVLKEDLSVKHGGIGYDAGEYHITVNVSDPGAGELAATVTMYRPGAGNTSNALFTNAYSVEPTTITLEGTKSLVNLSNNQPMGMDEGDFTFLVMEGSAVAATGYNLADGTIQFAEIRYTAAGEHTYSVVEVPGDAGGVDYDNEAFTVKVTVVDNGNGTLTANADYVDGPVVFENTYDPASAQVTLSGKKSFNGDWSAVSDADKQFVFELYETDASFTVSGDAVDATISAVDGSFTFGATNYHTAGTHYYVIMEENAGQTINGITYSNTRTHVTVKVDDDGNGHLIPTVTTTDAGAVITSNNNVATVEGLSFSNGYAVESVGYTPKAKKIYDGNGTEPFDFVLTGAGFPRQVKQNTTAGDVVFDELTFTQAGIYTFTIKERENILWNFIKWDINVYTLEIEVIDNGKGQLEIKPITITSENDRDNLLFHNVDKDRVTQKDVFEPGNTTVSINGKKVEKGDILLYQITYTNYTGKAADVTITDTIPQNTSYVEGSASDNGSFDGSKLIWVLNDVAADAVITVSFRVKVTGSAAPVENQAIVQEGNNEYTTNEVSNPVAEDEVEKDVFHVAEPTVSIDGEQVSVGDILLYEVTYTNADDFAADVTITDTIPEHTTYVEGSASDSGSFDGAKLTWTLNLAAGQSKSVTFQVKVNDPNVFIDNQAIALEGENELKTNVVTNHTYEEVGGKDVALAEKPAISIDGQMVQVGQVLEYTISYTNITDAPVDVDIVDVIPAHTKLHDAKDGTVAGNEIKWSVPGVQPRQTVTVSFQVTVQDPGAVIENRANIFDGTNKVTNKVTNSTPEKLVDKQTASAGDVLTFTINYINTTGKAADVVITDKLDKALTYIEGTAGTGVYADGTITWKFEDVPADKTVSVTFKAKVNADISGAAVTNVAHVIENEINVVPSVETVTKVVKPALEIFKEQAVGSGAATKKLQNVKMGNTVTYAITVTNTGEGDAHDVVVSDKVPEGLVYVDGSADQGGKLENGAVTWNLGTLAAGQSKTVSFKIKVPTVDKNTKWVNVGTLVYSNNPDGNDPIKSNQVEISLEIPASPENGDSFNATLFISMMVLSSFGLAAVMVYKKKEEKEETAQ